MFKKERLIDAQFAASLSYGLNRSTLGKAGFTESLE